MTIHPCYIGCDISKSHLDIFDPLTTKLTRIANTQAAIAGHLSSFATRAVIVVYEATGRYDTALRRGLEAAGIPGCRTNPAMARQFARATGRKAKTDRVDAMMLSDLGRCLTPPADPPACALRTRLADLATRRDQLVALRAAEKNHLEKTEHPDIVASIHAVIAGLSEQISQITKKIEALIAAEQTLHEEARRLQSAPGVGPVTAVTLLARMPELGTLTPKTAAALAGLAPFNHDSGKLRGRRCISGGRGRVRRALYMAALSAIKTPGTLRDMYQRLTARGTAKKAALIAVARKLLTILNAMARDKKNFA